jgi:hypothetical protein
MVLGRLPDIKHRDAKSAEAYATEIVAGEKRGGES